MNQLPPEGWVHVDRYIDPLGCGVVYPYSIAEKVQRGDIFTDIHRALFWHYSGFAFAYGEYDEASLHWLYETFLSERAAPPRRFILFTSGEKITNYFTARENVLLERRCFFTHQRERSQNVPELPAGYRLREIDGEILNKICGAIIPFFSWDSAGEFLQKGRGYCVLERDRPAAWAFSAAVSGEEIDIGVETVGGCQRLGLGTVAAEAMVQYSLEQGKRPVWACHSRNIASQKLAGKLGFVKSAECYTIKRK